MADEGKWLARLVNSYTLVAVDEDDLIGFVNLEADGYIDNLYTSCNHQG